MDVSRSGVKEESILSYIEERREADRYYGECETKLIHGVIKVEEYLRSCQILTSIDTRIMEDKTLNHLDHNRIWDATTGVRFTRENKNYG